MIMRVMNSMAVGRPRVIASVFSVAQSGRARRAVVRTWSESVRLVPKNLGIGRPRTLADDIPGGAIGMVYLLKEKTSKPRNPCEHLCASLVWVTSFLDDIPGGGHWNGFPGAWDANLAIPANTLCASLAWDVGPASCSFLSKRESEAGSSETTHFARGPCENHPCRYSCLCVSGGTKFPGTGR